ncbi:2-nitropropane dioxygenase [Centipeda periodontii DSM 2778]|uniref:2-nitropropane dioxygenase n=1 Tax=Centipeda periodontii DSM 2778 TaxID=888060 RepID=F5RPC7_9FIRM|nr:2-nitropropane dioxygenase [Centipeda periodontii DSM 2778]
MPPNEGISLPQKAVIRPIIAQIAAPCHKNMKELLIKRTFNWRRFFVRTMWKTGRSVVLCGGFADEVLTVKRCNLNLSMRS